MAKRSSSSEAESVDFTALEKEITALKAEIAKLKKDLAAVSKVKSSGGSDPRLDKVISALKELPSFRSICANKKIEL